MKCFVGLGSNLGNRRENLEQAVNAVAALSQGRFIRVASIYETPALVPVGAHPDWRLPYLNSVVEIAWEGAAHKLLKKLKDIEKEMGRADAPRWAPRIIDLDLLLFGNEVIQETGLQVPHPELLQRSFVLDPIKDLNPLLHIPRCAEPVLTQAKKLATHFPWIMAILNLTPDSFSDGGEMQSLESIASKIDLMERSGVHAIDIGGESTRPDATAISSDEERSRLKPALELLRERYKKIFFKPFLSVDTRRAETAAFALENDVDCINDVSGLSDPCMLDLLASSSCDYVLTHSLTIPADPRITLPSGCDPVNELKKWLSEKLEILDSRGIDLRRIIFDPGIGFGKKSAQSISILKRVDEFIEHPVRLLVGHSRKSFMKSFGVRNRKDGDAATVAISLDLARKGVDILRVHDFESHLAAFRVAMEIRQ
jgi:2-amino-4-hydroxy-6-hydroxymethyldihydropteridine diphosphokinase/dihydropteroate synthase